MVSLKDIANACGVSVATVSKALNNQKDVGEETRSKVCETAKKMGYFPNAQARALKTNRTHNIGVLFVDEARNGLTHDYFSHVLDSFKRRAEEHGYDITFINSNKCNGNQMSYLERSLYRGFDGVVIACVDFQDPQVLELIQSEIPVVTIDFIFQGVSAVLSDNVKGMEDLFTHIYQKGHRKVAYIHGAPSAVTRNRITSFYRTAEKFGVEVPDEYVKESAYRDMVQAVRQTETLLDLKTPPTCIIYPDDFSAFGGINAIHSRGLRVPEDISVAGYDGIELAKQLSPKLTTIQQNTEELGMNAAEQLISLIESPKKTVITPIVVTGNLLMGESVKDIGNSNQ